MRISSGLVQLCFELDRFQIATAIGHISNDAFVHWNRSFPSRLGLDEEEMKTVELRNIIVTDAPLVEASEQPIGALPVGLFSDSAIRIPAAALEMRPRQDPVNTTTYNAKINEISRACIKQCRPERGDKFLPMAQPGVNSAITPYLKAVKSLKPNAKGRPAVAKMKELTTDD